MEDLKNQTEAMFRVWAEGQKKAFAAQAKALEALSSTAPDDSSDGGSAAGMPEDMRKLTEMAREGAEKFGGLAQEHFEAWQAATKTWTPASTEDGVVAETLNRMLDPTAWFNGGADELVEALRQLVEGPELAHMWVTEREALKTSREWLELRNTGNACRVLMAKTWARAFGEFTDKISTPVSEDDPEKTRTWEQALDLWLETANREIIHTQRTEEFLATQRDFLRAGINYRRQERSRVEAFCEAHSIPTRTEVDELHFTVSELRRQVRRLTRAAGKSGKKIRPAKGKTST
jgi:hypothetical protein